MSGAGSAFTALALGNYSTGGPYAFNLYPKFVTAFFFFPDSFSVRNQPGSLILMLFTGNP